MRERLPVGHPWFVERHEVDLARRTAFGAGEEHLKGTFSQSEFNFRFKSHLVISLTKELQLLRLFVHEHPVEVTSLNTPGRRNHRHSLSQAFREESKPDLDGLVAPAHDLASANVGHAGRQHAPLQHDVLRHLQDQSTLG